MLWQQHEGFPTCKNSSPLQLLQSFGSQSNMGDVRGTDLLYKLSTPATPKLWVTVQYGWCQRNRSAIQTLHSSYAKALGHSPIWVMSEEQIYYTNRWVQYSRTELPLQAHRLRLQNYYAVHKILSVFLTNWQTFGIIHFCQQFSEASSIFEWFCESNVYLHTIQTHVGL